VAGSEEFMASDDKADEDKGELGVQLDKELAPVGSSPKAATRAAAKIGKAAPSPNPMTNLLIADIVLRGGGRVMRHLLETNLLKTKYPPQMARDIVKGRGIVRTFAGAAIARLATRSVPGALVVGGGLLAKALYDRRKGEEARVKGEKAVDRRAAKARSGKAPDHGGAKAK
jgi:hypothetical protein